MEMASSSSTMAFSSWLPHTPRSAASSAAAALLWPPSPEPGACAGHTEQIGVSEVCQLQAAHTSRSQLVRQFAWINNVALERFSPVPRHLDCARQTPERRRLLEVCGSAWTCSKTGAHLEDGRLVRPLLLLGGGARRWQLAQAGQQAVEHVQPRRRAPGQSLAVDGQGAGTPIGGAGGGLGRRPRLATQRSQQRQPLRRPPAQRCSVEDVQGVALICVVPE